MNAWKSFRDQFEVCQNHIYLNHAAVSPIPIRSRKCMQAHLDELAAVGAAYFPEKILQILAHTRKQGAQMLGCRPDQVFVVRSTTQGLGIAATGLPLRSGDNVVLVEREFPANLRPWMPLRRKGVELRMVAQHQGRVSVDEIEKRVDQKTKAVSVSFVQFLSGFRIDLERVGRICKKHDALLVVDAIQGLGVFPLEVEAMGIDFLSADSHKWMLGPAGAGLGYASDKALNRLQPVLEGWLAVEKPFDFFDLEQPLKSTAARYEDSAYNVVGIYGMAGSLDLILELGVSNISERLLELTDYLVERLPSAGWQVLSPRRDSNEKSGIVSSRKPGVDAEKLAIELKAGKFEISIRDGALRVSPHAYNTENELDELIRVLAR